jgi:hypothetical protein
MRARKTPDLARMLAVYSGQQVCGYFFRHQDGEIEVFDIAGISIGLYPDQTRAAAALYQRRPA